MKQLLDLGSMSGFGGEIWRWDRKDKEILGRKMWTQSERGSEASDVGQIALPLKVYLFCRVPITFHTCIKWEQLKSLVLLMFCCPSRSWCRAMRPNTHKRPFRAGARHCICQLPMQWMRARTSSVRMSGTRKYHKPVPASQPFAGLDHACYCSSKPSIGSEEGMGA